MKSKIQNTILSSITLTKSEYICLGQSKLTRWNMHVQTDVVRMYRCMNVWKLWNYITPLIPERGIKILFCNSTASRPSFPQNGASANRMYDEILITPSSRCKLTSLVLSFFTGFSNTWNTGYIRYNIVESTRFQSRCIFSIRHILYFMHTTI